MEALFEHRIDVAGHSTRAFESAGEGPGIVLLHGWGDAADVWLGAVEQRANVRVRRRSPCGLSADEDGGTARARPERRTVARRVAYACGGLSHVN